MDVPTHHADQLAAASKEFGVEGLSEKLAQESMLDLVFLMDCTGSMGSYIHSAQQTINRIVEEIVATEKASVRFGLIGYRDHPPQEDSYVTMIFPFTSSVKTMREQLDKLNANGGGDNPEAVADGLHAVLQLSYRESATRVCLLIADAPPHGLDASGDTFPDGCPCGFDPIVLCRGMAEAGITLYCIGCEPSLCPYKSFFMAMTSITGGQYCALSDATALASAVVAGVREEISLERVMREVDAQLDQCGDMTPEAQAAFIHQKMQERGVTSRHMRAGTQRGGELPTDAARDIQQKRSLAEVRVNFAKDKVTSSHQKAAYGRSAARSKHTRRTH